MDTVRDLAGGDPWQQSLERSRARRRTPRRPRATAPRRLPSYWTLCWRLAMRRWMTVILIAAGLLTLALLAMTPPGPSVEARARVSAAAVTRPPATASPAAERRGVQPAGITPAPSCQPSGSSAGYVNPLAHATVVSKRIDQGVDYVGSGALSAIGAARITELAIVDTGWPGAFIEYQLLGGPEAGCYVFYAEAVTPVPGLHAGQTVGAGQTIATIIPDAPSGIEIGWGAGDGTKTYAAVAGQWSRTHEANDIPSAAGLWFSGLIARLGGPPGRVEG